ncbi:uncharacterized protein LOC128208461 [Mya arenaria]|uniref:uncharacterized protein LOC128208461 n=1 Tax=Mya arenaria TaxID=6604 RepID=UPI0022E3C6CB|nr:uncharacterized protein LOC128208461 [Mya arenaria]
MQIGLILPILLLAAGTAQAANRSTLTHVDVLVQRHDTIEKCAKACLQKGESMCRYFKFVNATRQCYLSSKVHPDVKNTAPGSDKGNGTKLWHKLQQYQVHKKLGNLKEVKHRLTALKTTIDKKIARTNRVDKGIVGSRNKQSKVLAVHQKIILTLARNVVQIKNTMTWLHDLQKKIRGQLDKALTGGNFANGRLKYFVASNVMILNEQKAYRQVFKKLQNRHRRLQNRIRQLTNDVRNNGVTALRLMKKLTRGIVKLAQKGHNVNVRLNNAWKLLYQVRNQGGVSHRQINMLRKFLQALHLKVNQLAALPAALKGAALKDLTAILMHLARIDGFNKQIGSKMSSTQNQLAGMMGGLTSVLSFMHTLQNQLTNEKLRTDSIMKDMTNLRQSRGKGLPNIAALNSMSMQELFIIFKVHKILASKLQQTQGSLQNLSRQLARQHKITRKVNVVLVAFQRFFERKIQRTITCYE